jgi:hypothetical protein
LQTLNGTGTGDFDNRGRSTGRDRTLEHGLCCIAGEVVGFDHTDAVGNL